MKEKSESNHISRRSFIKGMGLTSVGAATLSGETISKQLKNAGLISPESIVPTTGINIKLNVNGEDRTLFVEPRTTLSEALRLKLNLTGTKIGCDRGACGACTIILDGNAVNSCMTLALDAVGLPIETVEGLATEENLHPLQASFIEHDAMQCGFCTSGLLMSSKALLGKNPSPNLGEIKEGVSGNICRCGTYPKVFEAVEAVSLKISE